MRRAKSTVAAALVATALLGCSARRADPSFDAARSSIVGGQIDNADPAVVALWIGDGECTGTLISPKVVLTAAHCFQGVTADQMQVFFGTDSYQGDSWISVVHAETHPTGDVAALTMAMPGPAAPIPLSQHAFASGDEGAPVRVAGFGVTTETGDDSGLKRQTTTHVAEWDSDFLYIDGYSTDTCYGDSGGPAFMTFGGVEQLVGVTSFGTATCGNELSGETRVDTFHSWIVDYVTQHDVAQKSGPSCAADGQCATGCPQPDPDCACAGDGFCTAACTDPSSDPDCPVCRSDVWCNPACQGTDPDCESVPASGDGGSAARPKTFQPVPPAGDSSSCSIGAGTSATSFWLVTPVLGWIVRRRRPRRASPVRH